MNGFDFIGFHNICISDPFNKSYIVGASEEENERFREKLKTTYHHGLKVGDKLTSEILNDPRQEEWCEKNFEAITLTSENYNEIMKIKGMPKHCFGTSYGYAVQDRTSDMMEQYYDGNLTREEILQKIKNICMDMRVYLVQDRYTNGFNDEDNAQILRDIYEMAQKANARKAVGSSLKKGKEMAEQFKDAELNDWMYYDADDYYKSEDMRDCIRQAIREMAEEWEITAPNFEEVENNSGQTLDGKLDYNSIWQWHAWQRGVICMTDLNTAPPEGFSFFYKERQDTQHEQGYVEITYKGKTWKADVPYNNFDLNKDRIQFFQMGSFANKYLVECSKTDCKEFLKKFEIFQKGYMRDDKKWWEF